jgi:hypothetical protein
MKTLRLIPLLLGLAVAGQAAPQARNLFAEAEGALALF